MWVWEWMLWVFPVIDRWLIQNVFPVFAPSDPQTGYRVGKTMDGCMINKCTKCDMLMLINGFTKAQWTCGWLMKPNKRMFCWGFHFFEYVNATEYFKTCTAMIKIHSFERTLWCPKRFTISDFLIHATSRLSISTTLSHVVYRHPANFELTKADSVSEYNSCRCSLVAAFLSECDNSRNVLVSKCFTAFLSSSPLVLLFFCLFHIQECNLMFLHDHKWKNQEKNLCTLLDFSRSYPDSQFPVWI